MITVDKQWMHPYTYTFIFETVDILYRILTRNWFLVLISACLKIAPISLARTCAPVALCAIAAFCTAGKEKKSSASKKTTTQQLSCVDRSRFSKWQAENWVHQPLREDFNCLKVKSKSLHVVHKYPWSNGGTSLNVRPSLCRITWAQRCIGLENNAIFLAKFLRSAKDEVEWANCARGWTIFGEFKGFWAKQFCFTEGSCCPLLHVSVIWERHMVRQASYLQREQPRVLHKVGQVCTSRGKFTLTKNIFKL